jgi:hypothetical protein
MESMDFLDPILAPAVTSVLELAMGYLSESVKNFAHDKALLKTSMRTHFNEIVRWSSQVQVYGQDDHNISTHTDTIPLQFATQPRKFRNYLVSSGTRSEAEVISSQEHFMILGDVGSGKTTTLKRLVTTLISEEAQKRRHRKVPLVFRLKKMPAISASDTFPLHRLIAQELGVKCEVIITKDGHGKKTETVHISGHPITVAIPLLLDDLRAILMLDGLDELPSDLLSKVIEEVESLALKATKFRLLVTCRSGAYESRIEGFNVVELCPLTAEQAEYIAGRWISNPEAFWRDLRDRPFADVVDRPLLLVQLLMLYKRDGYLPEQPSAIYEKLVRMLLEDWDRENRVKRSSRYASFLPERKAAFLASLAYYLTYRVKTKVFLRAHLMSAYEALYLAFDLPVEEGRQVVSELETHTGLIIESGGHYEFSHLSLQEYLCGDYLSREPFPELLNKYIADYPEPLAIANALSSNSGAWFAGLILKENNLLCFSAASLRRFVGRLVIERPSFGASRLVGYAIVALFAHDLRVFDLALVEFLEPLLELSGIKESLGLALRDYELRDESQGDTPVLQIFLKDRVIPLDNWTIPALGALPRQCLRDLALRFHCVEYRAKDGRTIIINEKTDGSAILWPRD